MKRSTILLFAPLFLVFFIAVFFVPGFVDAKICNGETVPDNAFCLNIQYPAFGPFDLNVDQSLSQIIGFAYYFMVAISGLAAFVMLVWGGVQWLLSGAIPSQASAAKDRIRNAILGLLLILASVLIIQIINPELTVINIDLLKPAECFKNDDGTCKSFDDVDGPIGHPFGDLFLKADGEEEILLTASGDVTLEWDVLGVQDSCRGDSIPDAALWNGVVDRRGGTEVVSVGSGVFTFILTCSRGVERYADQVVVNTTGVPPGPPPVVDLRVEKDDGTLADGPLEFHGDGSDELPDDAVFNFTLAVPPSANVAVCTGRMKTVLRISREVIKNQLWFFEEPPPVPGDWWENIFTPPLNNDEMHFEVTCYNASRTASEQNTVIIENIP